MLLRLLLLMAVFAAAPAYGRVSIVAAENFYGDVAGQIAGPDADVTSILSSPDQDPHLFEASPSVARSLAGAQLVIYNGVDYDPWMAKLLKAGRVPGRVVLVAADVLKRKPGTNPHLWYDPTAMPAVAAAIAAALTRIDPAHADGFAARLQVFKASLAPLDARIAALRGRVSGRVVGATEPVFGYMATALGLVMRHDRFQIAVMNGTEPRPSDVAAFEADLRGKRLVVLFYNSQATGPAAQRLLTLARQSGIAVVGVTETQPAGVNYQAWMMGALDALETAMPASR